jgi:alpha-tubulin suppressor-like RCC1 family protein
VYKKTRIFSGLSLTETRARAMMVVEDALLEGNASTTPATTSTTGRVLLVCACGAYEAEEEEEEEEDDAKKKIGLVTNSESCWSAIRARGGGGDDDEDDDDDDAIVEINGEPCVRFFAKKNRSDATSTAASGVVGIRAVGFASSRKHYYCATSVSEKRELLLSGWNQFGQLGDGSCQSRAPNDFRPVPLFERMRIRVRKVALGLFHSVVLCEGGSVYGFGANPQIGAPKEVKYSTVPRLIEGGDLPDDDDDDDEIEFIGCGSRHTLVASKRRAFAFGCNAKRQCGFAPPEDANDDDGEEEEEDEEERHNVYLPRETLSSSARATTIAFVRCERWSSFVGVVRQ